MFVSNVNRSFFVFTNVFTGQCSSATFFYETKVYLPSQIGIGFYINSIAASLEDPI